MFKLINAKMHRNVIKGENSIFSIFRNIMLTVFLY